MRNQNRSNSVNPDFTKTSRKYQPFCIQPNELAPGVKAIAELEVLHFLKKISDDVSVMVIDSRPPAEFIYSQKPPSPTWRELGVSLTAICVR